MQGEYQNTPGSPLATLVIAGTVVRYAFFAVGTLTLGAIGLGILSLWKMVPQPVNEPPAFRIATGEFAGKPTSGHIITSSRLGRAEVIQYGQLSNRTADLAVVMVQPTTGIGMGTQFGQDLININLLRSKRMTLTQTYYDLDTRFGEFRATEMRVDTDGRWKQCLGFRSRFDTAAVYFTGWYCDGTGNKPSPTALACTLDKLALDRELTSKDADAFLRGRMAKTTRCRADPVTQTTDTGYRSSSYGYQMYYRRY